MTFDHKRAITMSGHPADEPRTITTGDTTMVDHPAKGFYAELETLMRAHGVRYVEAALQAEGPA